MPAKLGEMLLREGTLNEAQLERVLNAQAIYGGRLGTNLVEMGLVGEEELARLLNDKLGVPYLDPTALEVSEELLALIPLDMVRRYRVLPVALQGRRLTVTMADPWDLNAIEEIGFVTGMVVVPRLCSELRLAVALERYFGIARPLRYLPVAWTPKPPVEATATCGESGGHAAAEGSTLSRLEARTDAAAPIETHSRPLRREPVRQPAEGAKRSTVKAVAAKLAAAGGEAEVVSAVLAYLRGEFERGAFLGLKRQPPAGVQVIGLATEGGGIAGGAFPLDEARQLKKVVLERRLFVGELAGEGGDARLLQSMGGDASAAAVMLPLAVAGQVVAVLCAKDSKGRLAAGVFELQRVAAMAELALEMLCIRKRITAA
jgi:hypothetical protein